MRSNEVIFTEIERVYGYNKSRSVYQVNAETVEKVEEAVAQMRSHGIDIRTVSNSKLGVAYPHPIVDFEEVEHLPYAIHLVAPTLGTIEFETYSDKRLRDPEDPTSNL